MGIAIKQSKTLLKGPLCNFNFVNGPLHNLQKIKPANGLAIPDGLDNFRWDKHVLLVYYQGTSKRDSLTRFFAPSFFINQFILVPLEMSMGRLFLLFHRVIALLK